MNFDKIKLKKRGIKNSLSIAFQCFRSYTENFILYSVLIVRKTGLKENSREHMLTNAGKFFF